MSLSVERFDDVTRLRMASLGSRAFGLDVSAYVIRGVMIDSGFHHVRDKLRRAVDSIGIDGCVVTHWHEDHAGNAALLAGEGVPLLATEETERILRSRPEIALYRRITWGRPPALTSDLKSFDPAGLQFLSTPGHSADHQVVWDPSTRTLFSGDLWLGTGVRVVHGSEKPYQIIESLRQVAALNPARMFDAHRGLLEPATNAIHRRIDWLGQAIAKIERCIDDGLDDAAITKSVLGNDLTYRVVTEGEYTARNLVHAVRRDRRESARR